MNIYFRYFIYIIGLDVVIMPLGSILGQSGVGNAFFHLFKIPYIFLILVLIVFHFRYKLRLSFISHLFILFGTLSLVHGVIVNPVGKASVIHFYSTVMPILAISFGCYFVEYANTRTVKLFYKMLKYCFYMLSVLICIYLYLYLTGSINYYGIGTKIPYFSAYFLVVSNNLGFMASILITLMTGKRSMLIAVAAQFLIYYHRIKLNVLRIDIKSMTLLLSLILIFLVGVDYNIFYRFESLFNFNFNLDDSYSLYIITSGRSAEVFAIFEHFQREDLSWFFGGGFGEVYSYTAAFGEDAYEVESHYAHFSPIFYVLVYGLIFTTLLYMSMFGVLIRGLSTPINIFFIISIGMFVTSFMGSLMLNDPALWFFFSALMYTNKNPEKYYKFALFAK
jgi:hypothetical protein